MKNLTPQQMASKRQAIRRKNSPKLTGRYISQDQRELLDEVSRGFKSETEAIFTALMYYRDNHR